MPGVHAELHHLYDAEEQGASASACSRRNTALPPADASFRRFNQRARAEYQPARRQAPSDTAGW